jgi:peptidyl-dipeptidase Dcp
MRSWHRSSSATASRRRAEDVKYYLAKYRADEFGIDPDEVAKYFEFDTVLTEGVFRAATGLYGITLRPVRGCHRLA